MLRFPRHTLVYLGKYLVAGVTVTVLGALSCSSDAPSPTAACLIQTSADETPSKTQTVTARSGDSTLTRVVHADEDGGFTQQLRIIIHGRPYLLSTIVQNDGHATADSVQEGIATHVETADGKDWTGSLGGVALMPFHLEDHSALASLRFHYADGRDVADGVRNEETQAIIADLAAASFNQQNSCVEVPGGAGSARMLDGVPPTAEFPVFSGACRDAKSACDISYALCTFLGTGGCVGLLFIPFVGAILFAACEYVVIVGCAVQFKNCYKNANAGQACCPVPCGGTTSGHCCNAGSTCFDPAAGLCCPQNHPQLCGTASNGGVCCLNENLDACVGGLSNHPACCLKDSNHQACNDECCDTRVTGPCLPDAFSAQGSECCPADRRCNGVCCNNVFACDLTTRTCECSIVQQCGTNCCNIGEACVNKASGECCKAGNSICNGGCCPNDASCGSDGNCCPNAQACGLSCCPTGTKCAGISGGSPNCCPTANTVCGNSCCGADSPCDVSTGTPACCGTAPGTTPCGPKACCTNGQKCINPTLGICGP